jgi:hypothetical protein
MLLALLLSVAGAQEAADAAPAPEPAAKSTKLFRKRTRLKQHAAAISLSGGLASEVSLEVTGEYNLPAQHAVAVILGVGSWQSFGQGPFEQLHLNAGAQYRYSVLGDFETGLWVGAEVMSRTFVRQVGPPWQLGISPLVGFKYTAPIDLVVDVSAGPSLLIGNFGAPRPSSTVNVQIGYAFGKKAFK